MSTSQDWHLNMVDIGDIVLAKASATAHGVSVALVVTDDGRVGLNVCAVAETAVAFLNTDETVKLIDLLARALGQAAAASAARAASTNG